MKATYLLRAGLLAALGAFVSVPALAKEPNGENRVKDRQGMFKAAGLPIYAVLNINNLTSWMRYDGHSNHSAGGDDGLYYPRGTGSAIYQDAVAWGAKVFTNSALTAAGPLQPIRIGGGTYGIGTTAGEIVGSGNTAVRRNANDADVRIFRIRRDYAVMSELDLTRDAASVNEIKEGAVSQGHRDLVTAQYALDWTNWPANRGAPYIERNGVAGYQAPRAFNNVLGDPNYFPLDSLIAGNYDEPGVAGSDPNSPADQVIWLVYNDLNVATAQAFVGSLPMGFEVQKTTWGYKRTDALGNLYFTRFKMINKGGVDTSATAGDQLGSFWMDSMYVCQWSDPDLGDAGDDVLGCDTTLSMGFVYNANASDAEYTGFSLAPPSSGYDFLAGPLVAAVGDSGVFDLKRRYGVKNLGMSSFAYFSAGSPYSDPPGGPTNYQNGSGRWWKMFRGFAPLGNFTTADQPYAFPTGGSASKFPLSGDPVTQTGWIDGIGQPWSFPPGDRRLLVTTGPFSMAPGDTQEIYVGTVVGLGADRLSSVAVIKANDAAVQETFNLLFRVSQAPAVPDVKASMFDGKAILEWGSNAARVKQTETVVSQPGDYIFEGYNVYQLPSRNSPRSEWTRLATYDLPTEPRVIFDTQFDLVSGQFIQLPVQFGSNSGIKRDFIFDQDYVRQVPKLWNGQEYYVAVTAYSRTPLGGYTASLESGPALVTVRPENTFGTKLNSKYGDTVATVHTGVSDGNAIVTVLDPLKVTGNSYSIGFKANQTWYVVNTTTGDTVVNNEANQNGDDMSPIAEGLQFRVFGAPYDAKDFQHVQGPSGAINPPSYAAWGPGFNGHNFPDPTDQTAPSADWGGGTWGIHVGGGANGAYATFVARVFRNDNYTRFVPNDYEIRWTAAGGIGYMAFSTGTIVPVPFELWCIGSATPNNPADDYRMIPWIFDNDGNNIFNLNQLDHNVSGGDNDPYTDWVYWREPNPKTPGSAGYNAFVADSANYDAGGAVTGTGSEVMARTVYVSLNAASVSTGWPPATLMPATGNILRIISTKPNTATDSYTLNTASAKATASASLQKASAEKVGVFPNPYYAFNSAETNRFNRFVTFNNLPVKVKIRIFNLAGQLVRTLDKEDTNQYLQWDLNNHANFPVASGMYLAHVEMTLPADNSVISKVLKIAVIQEQEILNTY